MAKPAAVPVPAAPARETEWVSSIRLSADQIDGLRAIQARTGAPISVQIRRAVDEWIEKGGPR